MLEIVTKALNHLESTTKDEQWVIDALPIAIELAKMDKGLAEEQKTELKPLTDVVDEIKKKYSSDLKAIKGLIGTGGSLRNALAESHQGTENVDIDGVGMLVFSEQWEFEVTDPKKVDKKYLHTVPNMATIEAAVKNGVRSIKGVEITPRNRVIIKPAK